MSFGTMLKNLRNNRTRLNQTNFAKKIGISRVYLTQIENNTRKPGIDIMNKIAKGLQIPLPLLMFFASKPEDYTLYKDEPKETKWIYESIKREMYKLYGEYQH